MKEIVQAEYNKGNVSNTLVGCERPISSRVLADDFLKNIDIVGNGPQKVLSTVISNARKNDQRIIFVSSVCPPYETDEEGKPTYRRLESGISLIMDAHLRQIPRSIQTLRNAGVSSSHTFLMADTEVDLQPFLEQRLNLKAEEFTQICQESVDNLGRRVEMVYEVDEQSSSEVPTAARFLDYFGVIPWYDRYEYFKDRLIKEASSTPGGRVDQSLEQDYIKRISIVHALLGRVTKEEAIAHIARQRAQYMAFASLLRERFEGRLVIINHQTPNFAWMNDEIVREPENSNINNKDRGGFKPSIPLIELNISTLPG